MVQKLQQYKQSQWSLVKQACLDLFSLGEKIGNIQDAEDNFWKLAGLVNKSIDDLENGEWNVQKNAILLLDLQYITAVQEAVASLSKKYEAKNNLPTDVAKIDIHDKLAQANLSEETIKKWEQLFAVADEIGKTKLLEEMNTVVESIDLLAAQFVIIITMNAPAISIDVYDPIHAVEYLHGNKTDYNLPSVVRTIVEAKNGEKEGRDIALASFEFFERFVQKPEAEKTWVDFFVLFVVLDFLYDRFTRLTRAQRAYLLQLYLYKAVMYGIDVRAVLQNELKGTGSVTGYLTRSKDLYEMIRDNKEVINVFDKKPEGEMRPLKDVLALVESTAAKEKKTVEQIVVALYPDTVARKDFYVGTAAEAVEVWSKVGDGSLIDWFSDHEVTKDEQYQYDLLRLTYSFGYGGDFVHIKEYFEKPEPLVSMSQFLQKMSEVVDLSNEKLLDSAMKLGQLLHQKRWIPDNVELVEFREDEGVFRWNVPKGN